MQGTMIDFPNMVANLFKNMGDPVLTNLHAVVGIAGELAELELAFLQANDVNIREELGDARFYFQALQNIFHMSDERLRELHAGLESHPMEQHGNAFAAIHYFAGEMLDMIKKCWAYSKELDITAFLHSMARFDAAYVALLDLADDEYPGDFSEAGVKLANQNKLAKRYPDGVFTNAAAQARADKVVQAGDDFSRVGDNKVFTLVQIARYSGGERFMLRSVSRDEEITVTGQDSLDASFVKL